MHFYRATSSAGSPIKYSRWLDITVFDVDMEGNDCHDMLAAFDEDSVMAKLYCKVQYNGVRTSNNCLYW